MSDQEQWGPWIEHDGKGCPCLGVWAQTERVGKGFFPSTGANHAIIEGRIEEPANWDWSRYGEALPTGTSASKIISYRIRKPRGMAILEAIARDVTVPIEQVDA